uniref:Ribosomal protein S10 n=1 Tax=Tetraselmis sp. CCMP 881 TaxID=1812852 RepID=A0A650ARC4_9CHLO|nr:ribosomal protein S10 [Tetraselmis sp. CCMP 881]
MIFVQFHIKSYRKDLLIKTFSSFEKLGLILSADEELIFHQRLSKSKKRKLTVIRSPHVHKKSREQFSSNSYYSIFTVQLSNINVLLQMLKSCSFYGVQFKVVLESHSSILLDESF